MKLLKVKWENIVGILAFLFNTYCIISHIKLNGFQFEIFGLEIIIYSLFWLLIYTSVLSVRQMLLEE